MSKDNTRESICAEVVRLLTEERKQRGLSGNILASKAGLSQSLISSLETNPWNPTLDTLLRIADVLEVDLGLIIQKAISTHGHQRTAKAPKAPVAEKKAGRKVT